MGERDLARMEIRRLELLSRRHAQAIIMTARQSALAELAERVEREEPEYDSWVLFGSYCVDPSWNPDMERRWNRYCDLLKAEAYRDAAAMLMPEGWRLGWLNTSTSGHVGATAKQYGETVVAGADEPHAEARARLAAALRAHSHDRSE